MSDDDPQWVAFLALCDAAEHLRLEASFISSPDGPGGACPMPGECHPAYTDKADMLRQWLNEEGPFAARWDLRLPKPVPRRQALKPFDATGPIAPAFDSVVLQRRRCAGPAPYVGRPFVYAWNATVDEYGRGVGGDSRIEYTAALRDGTAPFSR